MVLVFLIVMTVAMMFLGGCGGLAPSTPTPTATATATAAPTPTPTPTATATPTPLPTPTATATPTAVPTPTAAPANTIHASRLACDMKVANTLEKIASEIEAGYEEVEFEHWSWDDHVYFDALMLAAIDGSISDLMHIIVTDLRRGYC